MANWQLTLIILGAVFIGAMIPAFLMLSLAIYRAGREIAEAGRRLAPTLMQLQVISARAEVLSRGFEGGEKKFADLLATVGQLNQVFDRNIKIVSITSGILAAVGPALTAFAGALLQPDEAAPQCADANQARTEADRPASPFGAATETSGAAQAPRSLDGKDQVAMGRAAPMA